MTNRFVDEPVDFEREMAQGEARWAEGDVRAAARHFGRAHNRGQQVRARHVRAHGALLRVAFRQREFREALSQLALLAGAAIFTMAGVRAPGATRCA